MPRIEGFKTISSDKNVYSDCHCMHKCAINFSQKQSTCIAYCVFNDMYKTSCMKMGHENTH
jgi:hypothetical protein